MLTLVAIFLIAAVLAAFQSSLRLLSAEELQSFQKEKLFSGWYFSVLCAVYVGLLVIHDVRIALALAAAAIACTVYEHRKNSASIARMRASEKFKRRMILAAWLIDAVVLLIVVDAVLPYFQEA